VALQCVPSHWAIVLLRVRVDRWVSVPIVAALFLGCDNVKGMTDNLWRLSIKHHGHIFTLHYLAAHTFTHSFI
jgi:hypothetical protein